MFCQTDCNRSVQPTKIDPSEMFIFSRQGQQQSLLPQLQPADVIVIDNASFHHGQSIEELVADAGCEIWYLPSYSPDLNKIERWWFVLKNWMKQRWDEFDTFRDCVDAAFKERTNIYA